MKHTTNKFLAAVLSLFMLITMLPASVSAETYESWYQCASDAQEGRDYDKTSVANQITIYNAQGLAWLSFQVEGGDGFSGTTVLLANDINLDSGYVTGYDAAADSIDPYISWDPIGMSNSGGNNPFKGVFDGQGHAVSNIKINRSGSGDECNKLGLFCSVNGATIKNLSVINSEIRGNKNVGGIIGYLESGIVQNCYSSANVSGLGECIGGVTGFNGRGSTIQGCNNTGRITGGTNVGGITGKNNDTVQNCYNSGEVVCTVQYAGGVAGENIETIRNCYNTGSFSGNNSGGIAGTNSYIIENCYSNGSGTSAGTGGIVGLNKDDLDPAQVTDCYFSGTVQGIGTNSSSAAAAVTMLTQAQMNAAKDATDDSWAELSVLGKKGALVDALNAWVNNKQSTQYNFWEQSDTLSGGYPVLTNRALCANWENAGAAAVEDIDYTWNEASDTLTIKTARGLAKLANIVNGTGDETQDTFTGKTALLANDIDLNDGGVIDYGADITDDTAFATKIIDINSWNPIGTETAPFDGIFDGQEHEIVGVKMNRRTDASQGLFGNNSGIVKSLGVTASKINGGSGEIGGVVGLNSGTVQNCSSSAEVYGEGYGTCVGGVAGNSYVGTIESCYNSAKVSGRGDLAAVGGVTGLNGNIVINCYNSAEVSCTGDACKIGGVVGDNQKTVQNCYNSAAISGTEMKCFVGGVVGQNNWTMQNCYNIGTVSASDIESTIGGAVGLNTYSSTVDRCYYLNTCGAGGEGTSKTTDDMKALSFADTLNEWINTQTNPTQYKAWCLPDAAVNNGYPVFGSYAQYPVEFTPTAENGATDKNFNQGDEITVNIMATGNGEYSSFGFTPDYDADKLELTGVTTTLAGNIQTNPATGATAYAVSGATGFTLADTPSTIATLKFKVKANDSLTQCDIKVKLTGCEIQPKGGEPFALTDSTEETVTLHNIKITLSSGVNAAFEGGDSDITAYAKYGVGGLYTAANYADELTLPALSAESGYRLANDTTEPLWSDGGALSLTTAGLHTTEFTENKTFAVQTVKTYEITFAAGSNGFLNTDKTVVKITRDVNHILTSADIPATVGADGYVFDAWNESPLNQTVTENKTYTVSFKNGTYAISNGSADRAAITFTGGVTADKATHGTNVTFTLAKADLNGEYVLGSVTYKVGTGEPKPLTAAEGVYTIPGGEIIADVTINVASSDTHKISFTAGANGAVGGTTAFDIVDGTSLGETNFDKVTLTPDAGYTFDKWVIVAATETDITNAAIKTAQVSAAVTYKAYFKHATYEVSYPDGVTGIDDSATHSTDFVFEPTKSGAEVYNVSVSIGGNPYSGLTYGESGYVIAGNDIIGDIVITATLSDWTFAFTDEASYAALANNTKIVKMPTAKLDGKRFVLNLTGTPEVYWSEKYNAYVAIVPAGTTNAQLAAALTVADDDAQEILYDGDIFINNKITAGDAGVLNDILAQTRTAPTSDLQRFKCDVDGSGAVTQSDVIRTLKWAVGITE